MPFMKGREPIRRTLQYLKSGKLVLKDVVRIISVNYNTSGNHHAGARDFVFWNIPQIQYRNPDVQVITIKNKTPSPFVRCYYNDGREVLVDIEGQKREDIVEHLVKIVGKTREELIAEARLTKDNTANFGNGSERHCICEVPGQVTCPGILPLPNEMRGKFKFMPK